MAATFVNICGPVVANTTYVNNVLVARDVSCTLPEVTPMTVDVQAMGTLSLPIWQLLENLEYSITKIGIDMGLRSMIKPEPLELEHRWVQTVTDATGKTKNVGCKAFLRGQPNKIPGPGIEIGSTSESECTYTLTRYQLVVDGEDMILIDRMAKRLKIAGVDYYSDIENML